MTGLNVDANIISNDFEVEHAHFATFNDFEKAHLKTFYMDVLDKITPGLHIILIHPAFDDQEMKKNYGRSSQLWFRMASNGF
ncbi:MAG: hypothetical protein AAGC45_06845 [Bacteroidota bacterium]